MICPHGHPDESNCPECSMLTNVKPLARASSASFTEMEIRRIPPATGASGGSEALGGASGREIPATTLRIKRVSTADRDGTLVPGNSVNLHARLAQVLGKGFEVGMLDEGVERLVKQIQKREANPRAKLD
ncbi:MAG: hypothetical protein JW839_08455 [Candidatus Lokiarchaeota archaeon]|nr:hypothetical protein [Candidatus Lokiarchaeota archaeon]